MFLCRFTPAFASEQYSIPETITVRVTGKKDCRGLSNVRYTTQQVDFKEYVKGVLPNEWLSSWTEESLKSGAVAVKMFAWSLYESKGYVWDCNWDQVYFPATRTEKSDKAVDETWNWLFWNDGPVRTYYDDYPNACLSRGHECMSQWQTYWDSKNGMTWDQILNKYYKGNIVNINYFHTTQKACNHQIQAKRLYSLYQFEFCR